MAFYFLLSLALALVWIAVTARLSLESLALGLLLGGLLTALFRPPTLSIRLGKLPAQLWALLIYLADLMRDILFSGLDLTRRLLSRDMKLRPGVIALDTGDPAHRPAIAALSADVITLTPGELVIEIKDNHQMFVHCLDVEASAESLIEAQARRYGLLRRILGELSHDTNA